MIEELKDKAMELLKGRQMAFKNVFHPDSQSARRVAAYLAEFCYANKTTFHPNPHVQAALEGRREVWLEIQRLTKLDPEQLWKVYGRKDLQ